MTAIPGTGPGPDPDEIRGEILPAASENRRRAGRWILGLIAIAITGFVLLVAIDWHVYVIGGTDLLDNTISAEGTAIATALAVIGGVVASWTFFRKEPPSP